ncbi:putative tartrate transporter [Smittium mucronatum]|uniref:Putative tartrate transporter n=1 Tax=Smittium mucronatum TaxID=133383 RepID=A0A1R0GVJ0_9FUNG|nr:putative tartrate transporter [Smittium mucronatum]
MGNESNLDFGDVTNEKVKVNVTLELTDREKSVLKRAIRKVDLRVMPMILVLYFCAILDRSNIGSALVNGLQTGLHLTNSEEANVTSLFYVFYIVLEVPANMLLKRIRPHIWFASIGILWSITVICLAVVKSGAPFVVLRCLLGIFECGLIPGLIGYLSYWYTRSEIGFRTILLFFAVPISGIVGAPLAAGFASVHIKGFLGFQNIFLLEGIITLIVTSASFFLINDFPEEVKYLTTEERNLVVERLRDEQGMASKAHATLKETIACLIDWKMWAFALVNYGINNVFVVIGIFAPTLIKGYGYSQIQSTYLAAIPSAFGLVGIIFSLFLVHRKVPFVVIITINSCIAITGFCVAVFAEGKILRLIFLGIAGFGGLANIPLPPSWMAVNQGGIYKSLISSSVIVSFANICGVVSPHLFISSMSPKYIQGSLYTVLANAGSVLLAIALSFYFKIVNKNRDNNPTDVSHLTESEQRLLNDRHPNFRYKL